MIAPALAKDHWPFGNEVNKTIATLEVKGPYGMQDISISFLNSPCWISCPVLKQSILCWTSSLLDFLVCVGLHYIFLLSFHLTLFHFTSKWRIHFRLMVEYLKGAILSTFIKKEPSTIEIDNCVLLLLATIAIVKSDFAKFFVSFLIFCFSP